MTDSGESELREGLRGLITQRLIDHRELGVYSKSQGKHWYTAGRAVNLEIRAWV